VAAAKGGRVPLVWQTKPDQSNFQFGSIFSVPSTMGALRCWILILLLLAYTVDCYNRNKSFEILPGRHGVGPVSKYFLPWPAAYLFQGRDSPLLLVL
jgi:hypothetical protein